MGKPAGFLVQYLRRFRKLFPDAVHFKHDLYDCESLLREESHCRQTSAKCAGRRCPDTFQKIKTHADLAVRQFICQYDPCLSNQYGGIPLMNREVFEGSGIEAKLAYMIAFPEWATAFKTAFAATERLSGEWDRLHPTKRNITKMRDYDEIYNFFMDRFDYCIPDDMKHRFEFWQRQRENEPNLTQNQKWNNDNVFAQMRLMGVNPLEIELVTPEGASNGLNFPNLLNMLNKSYEWDVALRKAVGIPTMAQAVRQSRLYVIRYPLLAKVRADPKASGAYRGVKMMSPIALFASSRPDHPLKPVAIQLGHTASSPVYSPQSNYSWWTVAKMYVNSADGLTSQIVHHLVNAHLVSEAFAVATFRRMIPGHPVHDFLMPHFRGLIGINTQGFKKLTSPNGAITKVAGFGHSGLLELVKLAYKEWTFDKTNFTLDLERRGMARPAHDHWTLTSVQYDYQYRDDGLEVFKVLKNYASDYVNHFYCNDVDVTADSLLQGWAMEISDMHKNKGFPSFINSVQQLKDVLLNILWTNTVHHAVVNYPVKEFGSHVPTIAYTLFKKPSEWTENEMRLVTKEHNDILVRMLPPYEVAKTQAATATVLASLRFKALLSHAEYYDPGSYAQNLTKMYYEKLSGDGHGSVQTKLRDRNERRKDPTSEHPILPYRYALPREIPDSIVI